MVCCCATCSAWSLLCGLVWRCLLVRGLLLCRLLLRGLRLRGVLLCGLLLCGLQLRSLLQHGLLLHGLLLRCLRCVGCCSAGARCPRRARGAGLSPDPWAHVSCVARGRCRACRWWGLCARGSGLHVEHCCGPAVEPRQVVELLLWLSERGAHPDPEPAGEVIRTPR